MWPEESARRALLRARAADVAAAKTADAATVKKG